MRWEHWAFILSMWRSLLTLTRAVSMDRWGWKSKWSRFIRKKNIDNYLEKFCFKEKQKYEEGFRSFVFFSRWQKLYHVCMLMGMIKSRPKIRTEEETGHSCRKSWAREEGPQERERAADLLTEKGRKAGSTGKNQSSRVDGRSAQRSLQQSHWMQMSRRQEELETWKKRTFETVNLERWKMW